MAIHNEAPQDSIKITITITNFKKLCLTVGMIISIICIFIFVAFIGNSVYSYDEDTFVRNTPNQYLIVGGNGVGTEVFQFIKSNCTINYGELTGQRFKAVGGLLGDVPILCGGEQPNYYGAYNNCITFENSTWKSSHLLTENRVYSAGVQINNTSFWILGGGNDYRLLNSTEFIIQENSNGISGPMLPFNMSKMCAVKLSEEEIFVIGGLTDDHGISSKVWIYNPQKNFERKPGPSLNQSREKHSCSIMRDEEKTQIVVAGGYGIIGTEMIALNSVEIYDPIDRTWHFGPTLPFNYVLDSAMAESPDGNGVLMFGGQIGDKPDKIIELRAGANSWAILNQTLKYAKYQHTVIPIP